MICQLCFQAWGNGNIAISSLPEEKPSLYISSLILHCKLYNQPLNSLQSHITNMHLNIYRTPTETQVEVTEIYIKSRVYQ